MPTRVGKMIHKRPKLPCYETPNFLKKPLSPETYRITSWCKKLSCFETKCLYKDSDV